MENWIKHADFSSLHMSHPASSQPRCALWLGCKLLELLKLQSASPPCSSDGRKRDDKIYNWLRGPKGPWHRQAWGNPEARQHQLVVWFHLLPLWLLALMAFNLNSILREWQSCVLSNISNLEKRWTHWSEGKVGKTELHQRRVLCKRKKRLSPDRLTLRVATACLAKKHLW